MYIFIKSFNRPYYLDRCLYSIERFVVGEYKIVALDDGTPEKYLEKIRMQYPHIEILRSEMADEKAAKIQNHALDGSPVTGLKIPSKFWRESIFKIAGDYFLLLEDDIWFSKPLNLDEVAEIMRRDHIVLTKLATFGNPRLLSGSIKKITAELSEIQPRLPLTNPKWYRKLIVENPFKILSIAIKLGFVHRLVNINYYTVYQVAGCIFSKDYYHFLWEDTPERVSESLQLAKAVEYLASHKPKFAFTNHDVIRTSFSSSATNMFEGIDFDVFTFNTLLNEAWLRGDLNVSDDLSRDISDSKILPIIKDNAATKPGEWERWKDVFRQQYLAVGHQIRED